MRSSRWVLTVEKRKNCDTEIVLYDDGAAVDICHTKGIPRLGEGVPAPDLATIKDYLRFHVAIRKSRSDIFRILQRSASYKSLHSRLLFCSIRSSLGKLQHWLTSSRIRALSDSVTVSLILAPIFFWLVRKLWHRSFWHHSANSVRYRQYIWVKSRYFLLLTPWLLNSLALIPVK